MFSLLKTIKIKPISIIKFSRKKKQELDDGQGFGRTHRGRIETHGAS